MISNALLTTRTSNPASSLPIFPDLPAYLSTISLRTALFSSVSALRVSSSFLARVS